MLKFGTDGIRGEAGKSPCTIEVAYQIGAAAVRLAQETGGKRVLVARDRRPSGEELAAAVCRGIEDSGGLCLNAGIMPTPGVSVSLECGLADTGVMITASHNPASDNGFKVIAQGGRKLSDEQRIRVETWLSTSIIRADGGRVEDVHQQAWQTYLNSVSTCVPELEVFRGRRIALDCANGALSPIAEYLQGLVPADWVLIAAGDGVINEGVGSENPETLQKVVLEERCEAGIAVDGDADRCRLVDAAGNVVVGDALAWLLAVGLKVPSLAVTVMSNGALEGSLPGVTVVRTPVGDRHLRHAMDEQAIPLGCEESGHVLFGDRIAGDGLTTGLRALEIAFRGGGLAECTQRFIPLPRQLAKVRVKSRPVIESVPALMDIQEQRTSELGPGGRIFLRYSGTEPVLRVLVEGASQDVVMPVLDDICRLAREVLS